MIEGTLPHMIWIKGGFENWFEKRKSVFGDDPMATGDNTAVAAHYV